MSGWRSVTIDGIDAVAFDTNVTVDVAVDKTRRVRIAAWSDDFDEDTEVILQASEARRLYFALGRAIWPEDK